MKIFVIFFVVLLASSFAHPWTSHLLPRSSGRAGGLAMACRNVTRDATTFPTRRSPPNKRTRSLVLSHHLYLAAKVQKYVVLDTTHKSQLTLLIEARVKCSERERRYFARVNSNCLWAGVAKTRLAMGRHPFFFFSSLCGLAVNS